MGTEGPEDTGGEVQSGMISRSPRTEGTPGAGDERLGAGNSAGV